MERILDQAEPALEKGARGMATKRIVVGVFSALALVLVGSSPADAGGDPKGGYSRVKVKPAGISIAIPDTFEIFETTRDEARAIVELNPGLYPDVDVGIEQLLAQPLAARVDENADGYPDALLELNVLPALLEQWTRSLVRATLVSQGIRGIEVQRTKVDGKNAIVANYVYELTRDDGVPISAQVTAYYFKPGPRLVVIGFTQNPDGQHRDAFDAMIRSVKRLA